LHYDVLTTPEIQYQADLKVDSTIGFNRNIGFRAGASFPFWVWDHHGQKSLPILQIPLHIMDVSLFRQDTLDYDKLTAMDACIYMLDHVANIGGCLTLNWHTNLLHIPEMRSIYETLLAEAAKRGAWGCRMRDVYNLVVQPML
jgi:hypothetical protein